MAKNHVAKKDREFLKRLQGLCFGDLEARFGSPYTFTAISLIVVVRFCLRNIKKRLERFLGSEGYEPVLDTLRKLADEAGSDDEEIHYKDKFLWVAKNKAPLRRSLYELFNCLKDVSLERIDEKSKALNL